MTRNLRNLVPFAILLSLAVAITGCADLLEDLENLDPIADSSESGPDDLPAPDPGDVPDDGVDPPADTPDFGSPPPADPPADTGAVAPPPEPEPLPPPEVELRDARMFILVVGGTLSVSVEADWSATGRDDLTVDLQVLSSITYRAWTDIATDLPPVFFSDVSFPVTQGERRFDFRVVARDSAGNEWTSNVITIQ